MAGERQRWVALMHRPSPSGPPPIAYTAAFVGAALAAAASDAKATASNNGHVARNDFSETHNVRLQSHEAVKHGLKHLPIAYLEMAMLVKTL